MKNNKFTHWFKVIFLGIMLGFALQFVRAWTEPSVAPPGGNVGAPINTGGTAQTKSGDLTSGGKITSQWLCLSQDPNSCIDHWPTAPPASGCKPCAYTGGSMWPWGAYLPGPNNPCGTRLGLGSPSNWSYYVCVDGVWDRIMYCGGSCNLFPNLPFWF